MVFAGVALALFGFAALATEGGSWYFTQRNARTAADTAALAGATSYLRASSDTPVGTKQSGARTAALDTSARNDFRDGADRTTVTVNVPPLSGRYVGQEGYVEVIVERRLPTFLTGLLIGEDEVVVRARAVAGAMDDGRACILALETEKTGIDGKGNAAVSAPNCVMHANSRYNSGLDFNGQMPYKLTALGVSVVGGCVGVCTYNDPSGTTQPVRTGATTVQNPYEKLNDVVEAYTANVALRPSDCVSVPNQPLNSDAAATQLVNNINDAYRAGSPVVLCSDNNNTSLKLTGANLVLPEGRTYIFWNAGLELQNGSLTCNACTFVFTGNQGQGGAINLNGGTITLTAATGSIDTPLPNEMSDAPIIGVAMWRDPRSTATSGNVSVKVNGNVFGTIKGALVFPGSDVRYNGTSLDKVSCGVLIGKEFIFEGNNNLNVSTCDEEGVRTPRIRVVRLFE